VLDTNGNTQRPNGIEPPVYRLPKKTHVGAVHLLASDLARSLRYYERVIGLRPLAVEPERAVLGPRDERPLVELQTRRGVTPARRGAYGLYHFAILLPEPRSGDSLPTSRHLVSAWEWRITWSASRCTSGTPTV
jgi:catechol-2,3-dioxygenase